LLCEALALFLQVEHVAFKIARNLFVSHAPIASRNFVNFDPIKNLVSEQARFYIISADASANLNEAWE
jgi:hypothetical protein